MTSRARRWLLCAFASAAVIGCLSPTLPLPPPIEPVVSTPNEMGMVRIQGSAPGGSWISAYNRDLGQGTFEDVPEEGEYDIEVRADVGHELVLWYELRGEKSLPLEFTVRGP